MTVTKGELAVDDIGGSVNSTDEAIKHLKPYLKK